MWAQLWHRVFPEAVCFPGPQFPSQMSKGHRRNAYAGLSSSNFLSAAPLKGSGMFAGA